MFGVLINLIIYAILMITPSEWQSTHLILSLDGYRESPKINPIVPEA